MDDARGSLWCLSEVDIFRDLTPAEMDALAQAAPMRTYRAGEMLYSPHRPSETLFILKSGRIRIFRVAVDGRALTTALVEPGTIFGEMTQLGQHMHDNFAEALEDSVVCVMSRDDVQRLLLSDPRIAARIAEILGDRLAQMERRLSDTVFKTVRQRIAGILMMLARERSIGAGPRAPHVPLTHEQIASLVGTSRETTTKVLGEFAERRLVRLSRGRITVVDREGMAVEAGDR
jgi:CRP-like cAMP-binding protein